MRARLAVLVLLASAAAAYAGVDLALDIRAVDQATAIGQSRVEQERVRFHRPYRLMIGRPPVDYVDVVTPFRRIVLAAQSRAAIGDRTFGQKQALESAGEPGRVELYVELSFHPLNTFIGVPAYEVSLVSGTSGTPLTIVSRMPRHGRRVDGMPLPLPTPAAPVAAGGSEPLLGGTIVAAFDGRARDPRGTYDVVVSEAGKEIARTRLALATLR